MKKVLFGIYILFACCFVHATEVVIPNPSRWVNSDLSPYVGKTVTFSGDWYVCNNYNSSLVISPRRIFSPTNMAAPNTSDYSSVVSLNSRGTVTLTNVSGYHRMGERIHDMTVYVTSTGSLRFVSGTWLNTREDLSKGYSTQDIDRYGTHNLLVCAMNLKYYLVENYGQGYGAGNATQRARQRAKIATALAKINADIYGLMEVEKGQSALAELAADLTKNTGRHFTYINDGSSPDGTYTKSGYVYCSDKVSPEGNLKWNNTRVADRKMMQGFRVRSSGESFIFSVNHFKAKVGGGTGYDADQGDGQGSYNYTRSQEAVSVLDSYERNKNYYDDNDLLLMGDLNAYAYEDPIRILREGGLTDLHRYFHADSSYSYVYHGEAGYLDHAMCNQSMLKQVTGMVAYHINSDESDDYYYTYSSDQTMFRSSDHDPVLVGLSLGTETIVPQLSINSKDIWLSNNDLCIRNAEGGHVRMYSIQGNLCADEHISSSMHSISLSSLPGGMYVVHIFYNGQILQHKILLR